MNKRKTVIWLSVAVFSGLLASKAAFADDRHGGFNNRLRAEIRNNRAELRKDLRELHRDRIELRRDRRELRQNYRELDRNRARFGWHRYSDRRYHRSPAYRYGWGHWNRR
jgi:hypothetical protein